MNVGLDLGYSATKVVTDGQRHEFPSVVGTPDKARFSLNGASDGTSITLTEPAHVLMGDDAVIQSRHLPRREDRAWVETDAWYHLALGALSLTTDATRATMNIITGLPIAFYNADKDKVRARLFGDHRINTEERGHAQSFNIATVKVVPQPFGALLSECLDNRGRVRDTELARGTAGIIDLGGKTCNLLSVTHLREIGRETTSVARGAWDIMRAVRLFLDAEHPHLEMRDHHVLAAIRDRGAKDSGVWFDLGPTIDEATAALADEVISAAGQLWNGAGALDAILICGGGAHLLGAAICRHFSHARVVELPVFANAVGYWKLAQRQ